MSRLCPCGSNQDFRVCCEPFLSGTALPATALALMKSRYTAFKISDMNYLARTTHPSTRAQFDVALNGQWALRARFHQLIIENFDERDDDATVVFRAHYSMDAEKYVHAERSRFKREGEQWYFVMGEVAP